LRSTEEAIVAVGNARGDDLVPALANVSASHLAGWLPDGRLVFASGSPKPRLVRALPGRGAEPWPGTHDGVEIPDTLVGTSVLAHRVDPTSSQIIIERIDASGRHTELARQPASTTSDASPVRCSADRAPPCVLHEITDREARWIDFDPATGRRGRVLHSRGLGAAPYRDGALSPDGKTLAIVEDSDLIAIDLATGSSKTISAGADATLETVAFSAGNAAWVTAVGFHGRPFGLMVFEYRPKYRTYSSAFARGSSYRDVLRHFQRALPSPDGKRLAVAVRELRLELVRVQGL
jgi:hypothetical protein